MFYESLFYGGWWKCILSIVFLNIIKLKNKYSLQTVSTFKYIQYAVLFKLQAPHTHSIKIYKMSICNKNYTKLYKLVKRSREYPPNVYISKSKNKILHIYNNKKEINANKNKQHFLYKTKFIENIQRVCKYIVQWERRRIEDPEVLSTLLNLKYTYFKYFYQALELLYLCMPFFEVFDQMVDNRSLWHMMRTVQITLYSYNGHRWSFLQFVHVAATLN